VIDADLLPHQVDILTAATTTDTYQNVVLDWAAPASRTVAAYVRPAPASENVADRDAVTAVWQVHTNDLQIGALDRVRFDGVIYDIDGKPLTWDVAPDGVVGHTKLLLRRVDG
jgi:hypothetical protein